MEKTILIIDDEKDLRTILSLKVNKMGYNVFVAENITEAINFLDNKKNCEPMLMSQLKHDELKYNEIENPDLYQ